LTGAGLSPRFPVWTGALLLALGAWTIGDAYLAETPYQQSLPERIEARKRAKQEQLKPEDGIAERGGHREFERRRAGRYGAGPAEEPDAGAK
jgi:hypothetical protein